MAEVEVGVVMGVRVVVVVTLAVEEDRMELGLGVEDLQGETVLGAALSV